MKIATLQLLVLLALSACTTPRTTTKVPALDSARVRTKQIYNDVTDAKGSVHRAQTLRQQIEDKLIYLK